MVRKCLAGKYLRHNSGANKAPRAISNHKKWTLVCLSIIICIMRQLTIKLGNASAQFGIQLIQLTMYIFDQEIMEDEIEIIMPNIWLISIDGLCLFDLFNMTIPISILTNKHWSASFFFAKKCINNVLPCFVETLIYIL